MAFPCTHKFYVQISLQVISSSLHKTYHLYLNVFLPDFTGIPEIKLQTISQKVHAFYIM